MAIEKPMTVADFIDRYYRPERLAASKGRRERLIEDRLMDLRAHGSATISRHDSVTGSAVTLYDPTWRPRGYLRWLATTGEADS